MSIACGRVGRGGLSSGLDPDRREAVRDQVAREQFDGLGDSKRTAGNRESGKIDRADHGDCRRHYIATTFALRS